MALLGTLLKIALIYQGTITVGENFERHGYYNQARQYCIAVRKPLLVVGMKRFFWQPPNGDVTVDLDPAVEELPGGVCADICDLPFVNKQFGAVFCPHVLEHLQTAEDVKKAVDECTRVAHRSYFLCPSPYSITANLFAASHHQRIWFNQVANEMRVSHLKPPLAFGGHTGDQYERPGRISQAFVTESSPSIVKVGSVIVVGEDDV
jgi:hypothetical protein